MYTLTKLENGFSITFSASYEGIDSVCGDVKQLMSENDLKDLCFDVILGVREVLTNAVLHGSKMNSANDVFFLMEVDAKRLRIRVTDSGSGFDWRSMEKKDALPTSSHGRGIKIIEQYFDSYSFNEIGNEIELVKII